MRCILLFCLSQYTRYLYVAMRIARHNMSKPISILLHTGDQHDYWI